MRRILVENARKKKSLKKGGDRKRVDLEALELTVDSSEDLLLLDDALERLSQEERNIAELVKLRFYAGLTLEQASKVLDVSRRTADRYWLYAKAWLYKKMHEE